MHQAAKLLSRIMSKDLDVEELKVVAIFCGVGLLASLLVAMSSAGFRSDIF
jgi:hypothetical protein